MGHSPQAWFGLIYCRYHFYLDRCDLLLYKRGRISLKNRSKSLEGVQRHTYSEARQKLASVMDRAKQSGKVLIRRKDGSVFSLTPESQPRSPLDVKGVKADISTQEIVSFVRESRKV